jgi:hypothetical protein
MYEYARGVNVVVYADIFVSIIPVFSGYPGGLEVGITLMNIVYCFSRFRISQRWETTKKKRLKNVFGELILYGYGPSI